MKTDSVLNYPVRCDSKHIKHLLSTKQFTHIDQVMNLFYSADLYKPCRESNKWISDFLAGQEIMATYFAQPSLRTRLSFETAMMRYGGRVLSTENAMESSSLTKGETLVDSVRAICEMADLIVVRHPSVGAVTEAAKTATVPVINAGDGIGEHPTQALLDLYTINKEIGRVDDLCIAVVGDLLYGRTVHSLINLLVLCKGIRLITASPHNRRLPSEVYQLMDDHNIVHSHFVDLERAMYEHPDVVYMTRMQDNGPYPDNLLFTTKALASMKSHAILMHPGPRREEIPPTIDSDKRAAYWKQVKNGVAIRWAIIRNILSPGAPAGWDHYNFE